MKHLKFIPLLFLFNYACAQSGMGPWELLLIPIGIAFVILVPLAIFTLIFISKFLWLNVHLPYEIYKNDRRDKPSLFFLYFLPFPIIYTSIYLAFYFNIEGWEKDSLIGLFLALIYLAFLSIKNGSFAINNYKYTVQPDRKLIHFKIIKNKYSVVGVFDNKKTGYKKIIRDFIDNSKDNNVTFSNRTIQIKIKD
jgi:hypothetical protein